MSPSYNVNWAALGNQDPLYQTLFPGGGDFKIIVAVAANGSAYVSGGPFQFHSDSGNKEELGTDLRAYRDDVHTRVSSDVGPTVWDEAYYAAGK